MTDTIVDQSSETRQPKSERIAFRTTSVFNKRLDQALAVTGRSRTDFIIDAIEDKVDDVLRHQHYLELSERDMAALCEAIENPTPPNKAMLRAIDSWRTHVHTAE